MKFTLFMPFIAAEHLLPVTKAADACGWDCAAMPDSVFFPEKVSAAYPHVPDGQRFWSADTPYIDPWVAIPAMAAVTKKLTFFTAVLKATLRQPLLLAKTLSSAAALFPDRIALGVGTSWIPEEFTWLREDMKTRGVRLDEMIEIIRRCLLQPGWVEFHGKHYDFDKLMMHPSPGKTIPIYVGGHEIRALKRAAHLGDGWVAVATFFDDLKVTIPTVLAERKAGPRAKEPFEIITCSVDRHPVDEIKRLEDLGVTNLALRPYTDDMTEQQKCDAVKSYTDEVISKVRKG